ncbi:acetyl-CoA C-acyltransferase [Thalassotalea euphylliae]|uniref:Acetyl-CoA C-acyltransferase n=1 Tax=Thalassotalea euphylliae TaxID=1655234 RepID=A0A3E0UG77_9GAMM|nr:acetyl-CoA C-acyltransferase [Thalassotalea euphylliae]REL35587.1 acetyl-CoA C-acyltransferase [Thalassotalea euphylliae]
MTSTTREAVIVSVARTPIAKAYRGAFNDLTSPSLAAIAINAALNKAGINGEEVDDCIFGAAMQQGSQSMNFGRQAAMAAKLPVSVPGMTIDRQCASGLMAVASAANHIVGDGANVVVAGGCESITLVQNEHMNMHRAVDAQVKEYAPAIYMPMLDTAEVVASRYNISRQAQDEYALLSQQRTAAAQAAGLFDDEILPVTTTKLVQDKVTGDISKQEVTLSLDEGNRPDTTLEGLSGVRTVKEGGCITGGNASQLSDGAAALVLMEKSVAEQKGLAPLGVYRGMAVAGCEPDEMGIGPIYAVPKLLERHNLTIDDIGLWELNEAFAVQVLYCADYLGIDKAKLNVNGGAISIGHPYGMSGARMVMHALLEGKRRGVKYVVITMCIGGGQGAAGLFEVL